MRTGLYKFSAILYKELDHLLILGLGEGCLPGMSPPWIPRDDYAASLSYLLRWVWQLKDFKGMMHFPKGT